MPEEGPAEGREPCPHCKEYTIPVVAPGDGEALARRLIDYAIAQFWEAAPYRVVRFRDRDGDGDEGYYFEG